MRILLLSLLTALSAVPASAQGIVIDMRETGGGAPVANQVLMDRTHVRAETASGNDRMAFVFDADANVVRVMNLTRKSYQELTRAQLDGMRRQIDGAMAMMQEKMKNMSPEQRAMMEEMMKKMGRGLPGSAGAAAPAAPRTEYRQTGTATVGRFACTTYDGYRGSEKVVEVCAADPAALGLAPADFEVTKDLAEFVRSLVPQMAEELVVNATPEVQGFSGIPVRRTTFRNGSPSSTTELVDVRRENIPASSFLVPDGFTREAFPGLR